MAGPASATQAPGLRRRLPARRARASPKEAWAQVGKSGMIERRATVCSSIRSGVRRRPANRPVMVFLGHGGRTPLPTAHGAACPSTSWRQPWPARRGAGDAELARLGRRSGRPTFAHPALATAEDPGGRLGNWIPARWISRSRRCNDLGEAQLRSPSSAATRLTRVTIFGESAGVGRHGADLHGPARLGRGGRQAVPVKGGSPSALRRAGGHGAGVPGPSTPPKFRAKAFAKSVGLPNATADQLRALPVEKTYGRAFPFIDGKVVQHSPGEPFKAGTEAKVPLIIGSNSWEGSLNQ